MRYTLKDVVDFCWNNKKHKGFKDHGYEHVADRVLWAADNGKLLIIEDNHGLCGICIFTRYPDWIYIHHIVATREGFRNIAADLAERFGRIPIKGLRSSKLVTYHFKDYGRLCKSFRCTTA